MIWKIAFALSAFVAAALVGAGVGGCAGDACSRADDEIAACSTQSVTFASESLDCNNQRQCQAVCIDQATCAELNAAFCIGKTVCPPEPGTSTFATCMAACEGQ